jgi:predicted transcriptional regulator of viral defense system
MDKYRRYATAPNGLGTAEERVLAQAAEKGLLRTRDVEALGIRRMVLTRLCRSGRLKRVGRGLYVLPDADITENHALAEACKRVPHGVVCLLSALRFHGMTTQSPFEVWIAIDIKARKPCLDATPLRVVRFSGRSLLYGVEEHEVEGVPVRVTSPAKTVADCFKFRNKIGLDVAVEALRDYRRARRPMDDLWRAAEVCRVGAVMRPYLEALE